MVQTNTEYPELKDEQLPTVTPNFQERANVTADQERKLSAYIREVVTELERKEAKVSDYGGALGLAQHVRGKVANYIAENILKDTDPDSVEIAAYLPRDLGAIADQIDGAVYAGPVTTQTLLREFSGVASQKNLEPLALTLSTIEAQSGVEGLQEAINYMLDVIGSKRRPEIRDVNGATRELQGSLSEFYAKRSEAKEFGGLEGIANNYTPSRN